MRLPTPPEIADTPELAVLASAQSALELMGRALVAANPELVNQDAPEVAEPPPLLDAAQALIRHAAETEELIERYVEQVDRNRVIASNDLAF